MEIFIDRRALRQIQLSVTDAIEEGDTETLREDIIEAFSDSDIDEIERRIDSGDFFDFVTDILDEWAAEDLDELLELLESQLNDADVSLRYAVSNPDDDGKLGGDDDDDDDLMIDDDDDELEI